MKRIVKWVRRLALGVLGILFLLSLVAWTWSCESQRVLKRGISIDDGPVTLFRQTEFGCLAGWGWLELTTGEIDSRYDERLGKDVFAWLELRGQWKYQSWDRRPPWEVWHNWWRGFARLGYGRQIHFDPVLRYTRTTWCAPLWGIALVTGPWPVLSLWLRFRHALVRRRRARSGCCLMCGYDLRESKQRCPECGTTIPVAREVEEYSGR